MNLEIRISQNLNLPTHAVKAVLRLLANQNTVPFIARYRKEMTGGLDEVQIRAIAEQRTQQSSLDERRAAVLASIAEQDALTDELRKQIHNATSRRELEDLYLPFKRKRRTRAQIARERGLEELAIRILEQPVTGDANGEARAFIGPDVADAEAALAGARDIVAERIAETPAVRQALRDRYAREGVIVSKAARGKAKATSKFEHYIDFSESIRKIPSHRYLAIVRGESEGFLSAKITIETEPAEDEMARIMGLKRQTPFSKQLGAAVVDSLKRLLGPSLETECRAQLKERSDRAAVGIFADNLGNLLLAAPLGGKCVIGIDPGLRTGCKCAVLDKTGKFITHVTLYLSGSRDARSRAQRDLTTLIERFQPEAIAVGNGTGGRETEAFVRDILSSLETTSGNTSCMVVSVSEAGASIYSASDIARKEFPDLDLTIRGAISIGRRLQDPLAELVKVDPKSIGVGQYQHDVNQTLLSNKLTEVVESCVNRVGVELNTASAALLAYVSGISQSVACKLVRYREQHGAFRNRWALLKVTGLGPRAFEQAAGFLRIRDGEHPLDRSAVHPERYSLVHQMATDLGVTLDALTGDGALVAQIDLAAYVGPEIGKPTLDDIASELKKPGRDPREQFEAPVFRDDVSKITDLVDGMKLEGVVTNVTAFGAFIDIGVHQDGLVHISELADRFVNDPQDIVGVGDRLTVRVLSVDIGRKRIALSAKRLVTTGGAPKNQRLDKAIEKKKPSKIKISQSPPRSDFSNNPFTRIKSKKPEPN